MIPAAESIPETGPINIDLSMFSDGFTVNDGPLRPYEDEASRAFMQEIKHGLVKSEHSFFAGNNSRFYKRI